MNQSCIDKFLDVCKDIATKLANDSKRLKDQSLDDWAKIENLHAELVTTQKILEKERAEFKTLQAAHNDFKNDLKVVIESSTRSPVKNLIEAIKGLAKENSDLIHKVEGYFLIMQECRQFLLTNPDVRSYPLAERIDLAQKKWDEWVGN